MMKSLVFAVFIAVAAPAAAQTFDRRAADALHAKDHEKLVDGITTALVGYALLNGFYEQDQKAGGLCDGLIENGSCWPGWKRILLKDAASVGLTVAIAETVKRLIHRTRPDGSDDLSFFSEHTALACVPVGWVPRLKTPIVLSLSVGIGRVSAYKHFPSDVAAGCAVGLLVGRLAR